LLLIFFRCVQLFHDQHLVLLGEPFNKYGTVAKNQVLAYNLFVCGTGGDPPFYGNCVCGTNNELRGYEAGRYLDRYMIATQAEYRLSLPKKFGLAAFGGLGKLSPVERRSSGSIIFYPASVEDQGTS
jgi:hypothetical protein